MAQSAQPHLPRSALIDAYGKGGFRFADMSHRGSLVCLPDAVWPWPPSTPEEIDETSLALVMSRAEELDFFILGTGRDPWPVPAELRARFRELRVSFDAMPTGPAVRTYNVLLGERRRVGAALIAVD
jgi:uncharacterized protein